ncbi:TraJ transfer ATPase [Escherichia coli]|uniref:TraJ transfer ATPase n=1 Tax=Escherichia coli TaxID=562 RepID=A0A377FAZ2_ECOLX|nr:TraJ transfer ATPase [Escherichia coli]
MNTPDEFGLFPFQRFTADELRHFFVWCAAHKVSDVDLTVGRPYLSVALADGCVVPVQRYQPHSCPP